ncbi:MAG TPA: ATP-dependent helicase, partial [Ornithinibacter sp.]|nr:ATP-dependent helicase [Ornithinibacter sp.]
YQCPEDEKTYLHRIGRTARAGNTGIAVTFVDWDDLHRWAMINKVLDLGMPEPQETYSSSPHLYSDLDIPEGSKGRLPRALRTREGLGAEVLEDLGETGKGAGRRGPSSSGGDRGRGGRPGGDSRGGRGGESRADSSRPASREGDAPTEGADRPKRNRNRRRTRGGSPSGETTS